MMRKILSLLLCLVMLVSCAGLSACDTQSDVQPALRVMYIPLDNRPINDHQVRLLAQSLQIELVMPETGLYATTLDGAVNEAGLQWGDRGAILEWMMENADTCDAVIVYLDQLLSGGLMNSRCMDQMEPVTLSDGSVYTEYDMIDYLAQLAQSRAVYVIDSQLRLAASNDYRGVTMEDYSICRAYGMVERPAPTENASIEQIIAEYPLAADGSQAIYAAGLEQEQIDYFLGTEEDVPIRDYHATRERKLRLNAYAIETLYDLENVRYYFGVDDSAAGNNIQSAEFAYLSDLTGGRLENLSAIDCLGELALSMLFREHWGMETVPVTVRYYGPQDNALNFAGHTVSRAVDQILTFCDAEPVPEGGKVEILIATDCETEAESQAASEAMIGQMQHNFAQQQPTIYLDFASEPNPDLVKAADITMLLSAGLHGNGSGASAIMGIGQGLARYRSLKMENLLTADCHEAFVTDLLFMFSKVYYWESGYKSEMSTYLTEMGLSTSNMIGATADQQEQINSMLTMKVNACSADILARFNGGQFISSLNPYEEGKIRSATIGACSYPWHRVFEFDATFTVKLK